MFLFTLRRARQCCSPSTPAMLTGIQMDSDVIVHLVSSVERIAEGGLPFVFTDGHAEMRVSEFSDDMQHLTAMVDWEVMHSRYWNDTPEHPDRKRRRQAEFLVHHFAPWAIVEGIGVIDDAIQHQVQEILSAANHVPLVEVRRNWYYP